MRFIALMDNRKIYLGDNEDLDFLRERLGLSNEKVIARALHHFRESYNHFTFLRGKEYRGHEDGKDIDLNDVCCIPIAMRNEKRKSLTVELLRGGPVEIYGGRSQSPSDLMIVLNKEGSLWPMNEGFIGEIWAKVTHQPDLHFIRNATVKVRETLNP